MGNSQESRLNISTKSARDQSGLAVTTHSLIQNSHLMNLPHISALSTTAHTAKDLTNEDYQLKPIIPPKSAKAQDNSAMLIPPSQSAFSPLSSVPITTGLPNNSSKSQNLQRFWQVTSKTYLDTEVCPIDRKDMSDPQAIAEYAEEVFRHMLSTEKQTMASTGYLVKQTDINEKMRAILIDWLIEVHLKFKLLPETLFLTVNLIDRFLERLTI